MTDTTMNESTKKELQDNEHQSRKGGQDMADEVGTYLGVTNLDMIVQHKISANEKKQQSLKGCRTPGNAGRRPTLPAPEGARN